MDKPNNTAIYQEEKKLEEKIEQCQRNNSPVLLEEIVQSCTPLVWKLVHKGAAVPGETEDLYQVGMLALILAIQRFDPERGTSFAAYAIPTIDGEIKRYKRDKTWLLHVPRKTKLVSQQMRRVMEEYIAKQEAMPTTDQLAGMLNVSEEEIINALEAIQNYHPLSIDQPLSLSDEHVASILDVLGEEDEGFDEVEIRLTLERALQSFTEEEQHVILNIYIKQQSQKEVATLLGLSQMQISRIQRRAITKLQEMVKAYRKSLGR
ncbi:sigma-70 family RNA polymerase sigma factor [Rubeoparvulum massiliense]|uniref:sigma-70 family RNA polymerase sigma factor n=1 Tax=Rubeoparvulum massiliense TaxID=1631346 RepID=UPI00065E2C39|nr:sigma-70 family RNA polymerase sigma factor [Rubeoparvulum massiliense]